MQRNTYIENNDDSQVLFEYINALGTLECGFEEVSVLEAVGRVTYEAIFARNCDPMYNAAAMDGIVVEAHDTFSASERAPLKLTIDKDFYYINTGGEVKGRYNAVIMIEDVLVLNEKEISIISPAYPWQHIRTVGESIVAGDMIIASRHKIRPVDLGAIIAGGITKLKVYKKPKVGIIPTGSELIENPDELENGKLMESNSRVFFELAKQYGGEPVRYPIVRDERELLKQAIKKGAAENDILIVNAGSSAGTKDYTVGVIKELGEVFKHGIAIKPGKPTILGIIDGKPVIGIPGYPVSAYLVFELFLRPIISLSAAQTDYLGQEVLATLTKRVVSSFKNAELLRVALGFVNDKLVVTPLDRGAAAVMSLVKADGIMKIDRLTEGIETGDIVKVRLLRPLDEIKKTLVITGSHDLIIDVISDKISVSSAHVGSLSGIMALKRGECHIAPIHLLDEQSGEYNVPYVKKYFSDRKMALIKGVGRVQGFIVKQGNPKNIKTIEDLISKDVSFANRQRGAGTRVLFDYLINKKEINKEQIIGYEKEYSTHMAVAISVKSDVADVGLGVYTAAKAMGLSFEPVSNEEYDFLVPYEFLEDNRVVEFINVLKSSKFKKTLEDMGGYILKDTGEVSIIEG